MNGFAGAGFATGLSQGIGNGMKLIDVYKYGQQQREQDEIKNTMKEGIAQSKAARDQSIADSIKVETGANESDTMTVPTYKVGDKAFSDEKSARAAAEKGAPSWEDFYTRDVVPKISEAYIAQGNMEMADKWKNWADNKNTQKGMRHWAQAMRAGQMGDYKAYAESMVKAYNTPGYFEDGVEADGYDLVKDGEGNVTGLTLKLRNQKTGETFTETVNGQEDMVRMGVGLLEPAKAFEITMKNVESARQAQIAAGEENRKFQMNIARDDRKADQGRLTQAQKDSAALERGLTLKQYENANPKPTNKEREVGFIRQELARTGMKPDQIDSKVQEYIGLKDDTALRARILSDITQADLTGQFMKLPREQQEKQIDTMLRLVKGAQEQAPQQQSRGLNPAPSQGAPMLWDSKTGKMVPYTR